MTAISTLLLYAAGGLVIIPGLAFSILSLLEGENRAAFRATLVTVSIGGLVLATTLLEVRGEWYVLTGLACLLLLSWILFVLPIGKATAETNLPASRYDEREIIFARARLEPGTEEYENYYRSHPKHKKPDDLARNQPGLLSSQAKFADPFQNAAAAGSFALTEALRDAVDGPQAPKTIAGDYSSFTRYVKRLAQYYGALECGIAELQAEHIYTHIGRGSGRYGDPVILDHSYAIAFTVEMDPKMTRAAPYLPITMESGKEYVEAAHVAVQLAAAIRELGYPARAHIDGNYRIVAPLIARDAGLGEIGRMGLLMTPRQGPRVRLGVVTTDLPLNPDRYMPENSVLDFCQICKKCAVNCPSQSIPHGKREISNGVRRWKINPETCYQYWTIVGSDCGRCMAVCPYSHPDSWAHNLVRWGIQRSGSFRRAALILDDFFYGKHPPSANRFFLSKKALINPDM
ncbi:MAG: reductive dehalogenase domain-containing protein [Anaerolineales bacterium]